MRMPWEIVDDDENVCIVGLRLAWSVMTLAAYGMGGVVVCRSCYRGWRWSKESRGCEFDYE